MGRTAPLTSKSCILYIYSTNVGTEYFKHALYSPVFSLQNAVCFIMLTCLVCVLFTFYIQDVLKLKKNNSGAKGLNHLRGGRWTVGVLFSISQKVFFYYQLIHKKIVFKWILKFTLKFTTAPTCFGVITIIRERTVWLAKVTVLKHLVKIYHFD